MFLNPKTDFLISYDDIFDFKHYKNVNNIATADDAATVIIEFDFDGGLYEKGTE